MPFVTSTDAQHRGRWSLSEFAVRRFATPAIRCSPLGDNLGIILVNMNATPPTCVTDSYRRKLLKLQELEVRMQHAYDVPKGNDTWTVDPVIAGSDPAALAYINTLMIQNVLGAAVWRRRMGQEDLRALTPLLRSWTDANREAGV